MADGRCRREAQQHKRFNAQGERNPAWIRNGERSQEPEQCRQLGTHVIRVKDRAHAIVRKCEPDAALARPCHGKPAFICLPIG